MQKDLAAAPTFTPLPQARSTLLVAANININIPPSFRESKLRLQTGTNYRFEDPVCLSFIIRTHISLREPLQVMFNLCHVLGSKRLANRGQTGVEELSQTFTGFGPQMQKRPTKCRHGLWFFPTVSIKDPNQTFERSIGLSKGSAWSVTPSTLHCSRYTDV